MFCLGLLGYWREMNAHDATYHRLARALQHPTVARVDVAFMYCSLQFEAAKDAGSSVPCLLYTSPSPRDGLLSRMPSSA